jgi:hypothetical protein
MNRREMLKLSSTALLVGASGGLMSSCSTADIYTQITAYVPVGLLALEGILTLLSPFVPTLAASAIVAIIKASFADLSAAITEYNAAPATSKATIIGKIKTILGAIADNFQTFLSDLNLGGNPVVATVGKLVQLILGVLAGFAGKLPGTPLATKKLLKLRNGTTLAVSPQVLTVKQFKSAYNTITAADGHSEVKLN